MSVSATMWLAIEALPAVRALHLSAAALERLSAARLRQTFDDSARTEFGRRRLREAGIDPGATTSSADPDAVLRALRPVTKAEIREAGTGVLAGGRADPAWHSSHSSGSTGEPFRVFYDPRAWAILKHLVKLRARAACGVRAHHRVALLDAIPPEQEGRSALERAGRVRRVSVLQPADRIATSLAAFAPDAIYGLPSALADAASVLPTRGARIAPAVGLFTSGELLHSGIRRALQSGYGCPVYDIYGTSETKEIAWECPEGSAHINADVVRVEILDPAGEPVDPGEEGDIVVTLLVNRAMPLVRYRTGDRGSLLPGMCRCGLASPRLGVVTGRESDVLELRGGLRLSPYALTCALEQVDGVLRYQVSQLDPARLRVRALTAAATGREATEATIRRVLHEAVTVPLDVEVEFVERFETGPRAKFRVIQPLSPVLPTEKEE